MIVLLSEACTTDMVAPPKACDAVEPYNGRVKEIIETSCNLSGCHDGSSGVGNYEDYGGILHVLESGEFRQLVIIEKTMPVDDDLSEEEFELLRCWSENGFPEN